MHLLNFVVFCELNHSDYGYCAHECPFRSAHLVGAYGNVQKFGAYGNVQKKHLFIKWSYCSG